jgi:hypothetical protein
MQNPLLFASWRIWEGVFEFIADPLTDYRAYAFYKKIFALKNKGSPPQAAGYYCKDMTIVSRQARRFKPFLRLLRLAYPLQAT